MRKTAEPGALGVILLIAALLLGGAPRALAEPQITEANPQYGDVLETLPEFFRLCFSEPVKIEEPSDWKFDVRTPEGRSLGLRIVFDTAGGCVNVYPGFPDPAPQGIWAFDWLVHAQADGSEGSGVINFQLGELQPGETPLERPETGDSTTASNDSDGGTSTALIVGIGAGVAVILVAGAGFVLNRRRAR